MKIFWLIALIFIKTCALLQSQPLTWNRLYDGPLHWYDESYGICQTTDGNYAVAGYTRAPGYVPYVIKMNSFGDTIWTLTLPTGSTAQIANCIAPAEDGGMLISGRGQRLFVASISSTGKLEWLNSYSSTEFEIATAITKTDDENFLICGQGGFVMKINRNGGLIWKRYFASESNDIASNDVREILTCGTAQISSDSSAGIIRKLDSEGNIIWTTTHRLGQTTTVVSIDVKDSRYFIGGTVRDSSFVKSYVTILDTLGGIISTEIFDSRNREFMKDLIVTDNGNLVMCIQQVPDSIFYITHSKVLITDMNLSQKRSVILDSAQSLQLNSITSDKNGFITATGSYRYITFGGIDDIWTIRMDSNLNVPLVNIISNLYENNDKFVLSISPNPFNSKADIFWIALESANTVIEIYDMSGRLISSEDLGFRETGTNRFNLNWDHNSSGVYICLLRLNGRVNGILKFVSLK